MQTRVIDGFEVALFEDASEPYIPDIELGKKLGFKRPRAIRQIIKRWQAAGVFRDLRCISPHGGANSRSAPHRVARNIPAVQFFLCEADALFVITKSETNLAIQITQQIIDIFMAWRRGQLTQPKTDPAIAQALTALHEEVKALRVLSTHIAHAVGVPLPQRIAQEARGRNRSHSSLQKHPGIQLHVESLFATAKTYEEIIQSVLELFQYRVTKASLSRAYQRWAMRMHRSPSPLLLV